MPNREGQPRTADDTGSRLYGDPIVHRCATETMLPASHVGDTGSNPVRATTCSLRSRVVPVRASVAGGSTALRSRLQGTNPALTREMGIARAASREGAAGRSRSLRSRGRLWRVRRGCGTIPLAALAREAAAYATGRGRDDPARCARAGTSARVLVVADLFEPVDRSAVLLLLDGDVCHRGRRRGAVPVLLARREPDDVPGAELLDGTPVALG